jgi:hypothetical protein
LEGKAEDKMGRLQGMSVKEGKKEFLKRTTEE